MKKIITLSEEQLDLLADKIANKIIQFAKTEEDEKIKKNINRAALDRINLQRVNT